MLKTAQPAPGSPAEELLNQLVEVHRQLVALTALYANLLQASQSAAYETEKIREAQGQIVGLTQSTSSIIEALQRPAWDWKPAARHIRDWIVKNLGEPKNVWKSNTRGVQLNFQMADVSYTRLWNPGKFKTLRGQLERKFGMKPSGSAENYYRLPDGTGVTVQIFVGGTPTSETLD